MSTKTVKIPVGKTVIWSVTLEGYIPQQGRYVMEDNPVSLDINLVAYSDPPFTMEFSGNGYLHINADASSVVQFNKNNTGWNTSNTDILIDDGDVIQFKGEYSTFNKHGWTLDSGIVINKVYGNIGSLLDPINYSTITTYSESLVFSRFFEHMNTVVDASKLILPATTLTTGCYSYMFKGCTKLTSAPVLPATTLANQCYYHMFNGCKALTTAPELPATTLAGQCYSYMFKGCTALTSAPVLPAAALVNQCYYNMFSGCKALTTAPELPATTLANQCYGYMFVGCTALTSAPVLPATTLAERCYYSMFDGCTALTSAPELPAERLSPYCYSHMFKGCTKLTSAPELPATTLAEWCYEWMFGGCTKLTSAPELPATTLAEQCYYSMFNGCTALTSAPELPATTLAKQCYYNMFAGCTALTSAPVLPAETLFTYCYSGMFVGCTALTSAPALPATTLAVDCYERMFYGCTSLTAAPALPATTLMGSCYDSMFQNCTSLTTAPELPAETLVNTCYRNMFYGCSNLNYIRCLARSISATNCTRNWVTGVAPAGTFVKYINNSSWSTGDGGIPTNWVVRAVDINQYIFAINPTPADAVVTINGEARSWIAADHGTTINWSVSKLEYTTKTGTYTLYDDHVENVELDPQCVIEGTCKNNTAKIGYNRKKNGYFYDYSLFDITYTQVSTNLYRFVARANEVVTSLACAFSLDSNTISVDSDANASSFLTITSMRGTDRCTNAEQMLDGCTSLTSYDLSEANFSGVTNINRMYRNLTGITSDNNKGPSNLKPQTAQFLYMRRGGSSAIVDASDMDWSSLTRAQGSSDGSYSMFSNCNCTNYNLSNLTIGASMYSAFERAGKLNTPMIITMDNTYVKNSLYRIFGDSNSADDHITGPLSSQIYIYARRLDPNDQNLIYVNDLINIEDGFWHYGYRPSATDNPTTIGLFPWGNPNSGSAYVGEYYYVYSNNQIVTNEFEKTKYTNGYVSLNISGMTKDGIPDGHGGYVMPTVNFSDGPNGAYDLSAYNWMTGSSYRYNYWYNTTGTTISYSVSAPGFNTVTGTATPQPGSDTSTGGVQTIDITLTPTS